MKYYLSIFYKNNLNTIKNITPGTPKHPAMSAVTQLMPIKKLKYPPIKFTTSSKTTPNTALASSLKNNFIGQVNTFTIISKKIIASKK